MEEIWKDVVGYEGFYKVSNFGNVKRVGSFKGVNKAYLNGYYLRPQDNGKGYLRLKLTIKNKSKSIMLHRIIAEAFIPNPNNYKTVHHIDNNRKNNSLNNLMWCTQSFNCKIEFDLGRRKIIKDGRKVVCTLTGKVYRSIAEASKQVNINRITLYDMLTGRTKTNRTTLTFK